MESVAVALQMLLVSTSMVRAIYRISTAHLVHTLFIVYY